MASFHPFSGLHLAMLAALFAAIAVAVGVRRRRPGIAVGPVERAIGFGYVVFWVAAFTALRVSPYYAPATTYPLQMCHWCALVAALVLVRPVRALRAIAYFCGLALCTQAIVTPSLTEGPDEFPFWSFWLSHAMVVGVPLYDVFARRYRPGWRDFGIGCMAAAGYVAMLLPIDLATGWNYGFIGPGKPDTPSLVDVLGPWPQRLVAIVALAGAAMFVAFLPWLVVAGRTVKLAKTGPAR